MAFVFPFEGLLKHRKRLEEVAKKEFFLAQSKVDEILNEINKMYERIDEVRAEISNTQQIGGKGSSKIVQLEDFIKGQNIKIKNARHAARELMQIAEEKREVLVEKVKEFKMIDKIKEKRKDEYKVARRKKEQKEIDDILIMRAKR